MLLNKLFGPLLERLPENNRLERIWKLSQVDFKKRYYNDKLGVLWALLNPIFRVGIYYSIFTFVIERVREGIDNFALFLFAALIFWMLFTEILKKSITILVKKKYLIQNIKLDVVDLFLSNALATLFGFFFNLGAFLLLSWIFGVRFDWSVLYLIILVANTCMLAVGIGMILAIFYLIVRDINHVVDILIMLGFWSSGIFFPSEKILDIYAPLYYINPFLGIFQNVRAVIVYVEPVNLQIMAINLMWGVLFFSIGVVLVKKYYYLAMERF